MEIEDAIENPQQNDEEKANAKDSATNVEECQSSTQAVTVDILFIPAPASSNVETTGSPTLSSILNPETRLEALILSEIELVVEKSKDKEHLIKSTDALINLSVPNAFTVAQIQVL